jgi:hypothetical protein
MNIVKKPLKQLAEINFLIEKERSDICMGFHTSDTIGLMKRTA